MKKGYLICPVRGHDIKETQEYVEQLEKAGWLIYWPPRDTKQDDTIGLDICAQNREAIIYADYVFLVWDGESTGCLFDLGIAWAHFKPLYIISIPEGDAGGKSFLRMIRAWGRDWSECLDGD